MENQQITIDIFCAPNCNRCGRAVTVVQAVLRELDNMPIQWRKVNVIDEIDYAISLGVRATPAIAINSTLVFTATPTKQALKNEILAIGHP